MTIKHSPIKSSLLLILNLFIAVCSIFALIDYLFSTRPYKDSSFFTLCLIGLVVSSAFFILYIRRLTLQATIIALDHEALTYCWSGLLGAKTYRIPLEQIYRSRYDQDVQASEISLWMGPDFDRYADFHHPRHRIYAYPDSGLISLVFKRRRMKELEHFGLDQLIGQYQQSRPEREQTTPRDSRSRNQDGIFF